MTLELPFLPSSLNPRSGRKPQTPAKRSSCQKIQADEKQRVKKVSESISVAIKARSVFQTEAAAKRQKERKKKKRSVGLCGGIAGGVV